MPRILFLMLLALLLPRLATAEIAIVVPKNSPINTMEAKQISDLFLSRTNRYPNGDKAYLVAVSDRELRDDFYRQISDKSPSQLRSYWTTLIFSGKGKPPRALDNKQSLLDYMEHNVTAISYINKADVTANMKVIYLFPDLAH